MNSKKSKLELVANGTYNSSSYVDSTGNNLTYKTKFESARMCETEQLSLRFKISFYI